MKTKYLIWKNPFCIGNTPDWQEITGIEFYALTNSPQGKGRYFVKLNSISDDDSIIVMEVTKADYVKWRKEKDHSDYIAEVNAEKGYITTSYHNNGESDDYHGEELLVDSVSNIEVNFFEALDSELLMEALTMLTSEEFRMIEYLYLLKEKYTEQDYSNLNTASKILHRSR